MARKIYTAKNGRRYIKLKSGKARFIKGKARTATKRRTSIKRRTPVKMARRRRYTRAKKSYRKAKKSMFNNKVLLMGVGAGMSGFVQGLTSRFIPVSNPGISKVVGAYGLQKLVFKSGTVKTLLDGVIIDGVADITAGLTSGAGLNLFGAVGAGSTNGRVIM